jgi:hypothetical protein
MVCEGGGGMADLSLAWFHMKMVWPIPLMQMS